MRQLNLMAQSLSLLPKIAAVADLEEALRDDRITIKKRSNSYERQRRERLLDDEQFSCDTSQYSAFDESDGSSILDGEGSARRGRVTMINSNNPLMETHD